MANPQKNKEIRADGTELVGRSVTPHSRMDVEAALRAVKECIVKAPDDIHLIVIKDVLEAELRARQGRGE